MNKNYKVQTITENDTPFACDMSALGAKEKKRVLDLLEELKTKIQDVRELADGFAFHFRMERSIFLKAAEFITYERLCCPFFEFALIVERENGAMRLELTGREGVKDFIRIEFGL